MSSLSNGINQRFPALRHRNFNLFFIGQCVSLIGTWMQNIGQSWLVLELTHSALKLSVVTMVQFLPMLFLSLFAGSLIDRFPKRRLLIGVQTFMMMLAFILATLTYFELVEYWHVLVLAFLLGLANTVDLPARQSYFIELVGKEDLMNAIALNSSIFQLARVIGPAIAGILIGLVGMAICFYINALSYVAVLIALSMISAQGFSHQTARKFSFRSIMGDIAEGLKYIHTRKIIELPLILLMVISTFALNYSIILPLFATQILFQDSTGYGFLMSSMGIGSFIGALSVATHSKNGPSLKILVLCGLGTALTLSVLGLERDFILSMLTLFIIGFFSNIFIAMVNSTLQLNSQDTMRGRVMSVYALVFGGVAPFGAFLTGILIERLGLSLNMILSGLLSAFLVALAYAFYRPKIHPLREQE